MGDGGDRYRTASLQIGFRVNENLELTAGFNLFTGDPGIDRSRSYDDYIAPDGTSWMFYNDPGADKYRSGLVYGGINYRGQTYRVGSNSEKARAFIQNNWHYVTNDPHFLRLFGSERIVGFLLSIHIIFIKLMKIYLCFIVWMIAGCTATTIIHYEHFTIDKLEFEVPSHDLLRINGIYLLTRNRDSKISSLFLYEDGSCLKNPAYYESVQRMESDMNNRLSDERFRSWYQWGEYRIENDSIRMQVFVDTSSGAPIYTYEVFEYKGRILNDTTFIFTTVKYPEGEESVSYKYHF